jgi:hypothetical protein
VKKSEIVDALRKDVSGGTATYASVLTPAYISKNLDSARAYAIEKRFNSYGTINPLCYQDFYLQYDANLQKTYPGADTSFIVFKLPPVINIGHEDGIRYLGALNCVDNWRRVLTMAELSAVMGHSYTKVCNHPDELYYYFDGNTGLIRVYNGKPQEGLAQLIMQSPSESPFYNEDSDSYPCDIGLLGFIRDILYERLAVAKSAPPESLPYEQPTGQVNPLPKNLRTPPPQPQ